MTIEGTTTQGVIKSRLGVTRVATEMPDSQSGAVQSLCVLATVVRG